MSPPPCCVEACGGRGEGRAAALVARAGLLIWFALPLVPLALWLFADRWAFPGRLPQEFGAAGLRTALGAGGVQALANSALIAVTVAVLATPLGALAGTAFARGGLALEGMWRAVILLPLALPPFAVSIGLTTVALRMHVPSFVAVVVILSTLAVPYTTYVMWLAARTHDPAFADEARTLGASAARAWWAVQLPLLAPALAGAAFLAFLVGWTDYVVTLVVGGGRLVTVAVLVGSFAAGTSNNSVVAALSLAAILPPLVFLALMRQLGALRATP